MATHNGKREVVVVTGAGAGLGRAIVRAFASQGADVALIARDRERLEAAAGEVERAGGRALVLPLDVADAEAVEAAAGLIEEQLGPIDIWVNNAMASIFSPVRQMTPEGYKRVTEVTYLGYVYGTLAALKRMAPRDKGVIVQVGSALAYRGIPLQSAYCAAKHAIQGFHDSLRSELIHDKSNIKVTMVQMPALNTPQFRWVKSRLPNEAQPVPPIFQPEVGARAVVWAARHPRKELYVGWPTVQAIVGDKIVSSFVDHYLANKAYAGQQTDEERDPERPHNVWEPVEGDQAAHGVFDQKAKGWSGQFWFTTNRNWIMAAAGAGLAALGGAVLWKK
ncbi:MAG: SDR family oxidoreductase [Oscillochloris sp.]|nr:SDR family oxidoreductase [Oscillochloris sp.]